MRDFVGLGARTWMRVCVFSCMAWRGVAGRYVMLLFREIEVPREKSVHMRKKLCVLTRDGKNEKRRGRGSTVGGEETAKNAPDILNSEPMPQRYFKYKWIYGNHVCHSCRKYDEKENKNSVQKFDTFFTNLENHVPHTAK